jgi:hypothetical protein
MWRAAPLTLGQLSGAACGEGAIGVEKGAQGLDSWEG